MEVTLTINEFGHLELIIYPNSPAMGPLHIYPPYININMECYHCRSWMYDEDRKVGHLYCIEAKKNRTIKDIRLFFCSVNHMVEYAKTKGYEPFSGMVNV